MPSSKVVRSVAFLYFDGGGRLVERFRSANHSKEIAEDGKQYGRQDDNSPAFADDPPVISNIYVIFCHILSSKL